MLKKKTPATKKSQRVVPVYRARSFSAVRPIAVAQRPLGRSW
jgi:hypothetical protein